MTDTPMTPEVGKPLDAESVKLLQEGDQVLGNKDFWLEDGVSKIATFTSFSGNLLTLLDAENSVRLRGDLGNFTFIGRPDDDGWMPWSGGENPVGDAMVEVRFRDGREGYPGRAAMWSWSHKDDASDIIAFRLAKPEPAAESAEQKSERALWKAHDELATPASDVAGARERLSEWRRFDRSMAPGDIRDDLALVLAGYDRLSAALGELVDVASEVQTTLNRTKVLNGREYTELGIRFVNAINAAARSHQGGQKDG